ncbi:MAG: metalloregulator ArsR/SmtB family transcription factor [Opitutaceae bacterium]|nr:metalloregulator ArsR/SmtB family transcription factor [Opitutaceae bacterium]
MSSSCSSFRRHGCGAPPSDRALELVARRFAVLAEPLRLKLIRALLAGEKHVNALVKATGGSQTNVSRHLQTLAQAQILGRRKAGLQVFYFITDPSVLSICERACGSLQQQLSKQTGIFG